MQWSQNLLWIAAPEERLAAAYNPATGKIEKKLEYPHEIWDIALDQAGLWMMTGGGKLGRQIVLWSIEQEKELRTFNCPDGAGAGITVYDGKLWITHRHNHKLICLDPADGKAVWVIRTGHETFSPTTHRNELWLVESDPGPLAHWSKNSQAKYFFSRYDPAREKITERISVPFVPSCMAFDGERFWYAEEKKRGILSMRKN
jgi:hypothetical protein